MPKELHIFISILKYFFVYTYWPLLTLFIDGCDCAGWCSSYPNHLLAKPNHPGVPGGGQPRLTRWQHGGLEVRVHDRGSPSPRVQAQALHHGSHGHAYYSDQRRGNWVLPRVIHCPLNVKCLSGIFMDAVSVFYVWLTCEMHLKKRFPWHVLWLCMWMEGLPLNSIHTTLLLHLSDFYALCKAFQPNLMHEMWNVIALVWITRLSYQNVQGKIITKKLNIEPWNIACILNGKKL